MSIEKGETFNLRDIFIDYPFEEIMYRWNHKERKIYMKFYGENELPESVPHDNKLFNDALLYGSEITKEEYQQGKRK